MRGHGPAIQSALESSAHTALSDADAALLGLLQEIAAEGYRFTTPAPTTHRRVRLRRGRVEATGLEDVFGWNLPFRTEALPPRVRALMGAAGILRERGRLATSALSIASVGDQLFLHSALPWRDQAHVFFGPDSYRFTDFLHAELPALRLGAAILDIGAGAGVGGIFAAAKTMGTRLTLTDVNPGALRLARINAAFAGLLPEIIKCDGPPAADRTFDVIVANPPYIAGSGRTYSDGGGAMGGELTLAWAVSALEKLAPGGRLLLYSGSAIVHGEDRLRDRLGEIAAQAGAGFRYRELDPDVFPATLLSPRYWRVERIAAVGAVMVKRS